MTDTLAVEQAQAAYVAAYRAKQQILADQKAEIDAIKKGKHAEQLKAANAMIARAAAAKAKADRATAKADAKAAAKETAEGQVIVHDPS